MGLRVHGLAARKTPHPLYYRWWDMVRRCNNKRRADYRYYGGRGITVCERWMNVENFVADMQDGFRSGLTIERRNNNKGYSLENCYWATRREQSRNRNYGRFITIDGQVKRLVEWQEFFKVKWPTIWQRLKKGWDYERVFKTPVRAWVRK
jgi:hypothetical protein